VCQLLRYSSTLHKNIIVFVTDKSFESSQIFESKPKTIFTTLHFLCNLQMGSKSESVTLLRQESNVRDKHSSLHISYEEN
jgi:hypothetical protein